jgi:hypothetical protein
MYKTDCLTLLQVAKERLALVGDGGLTLFDRITGFEGDQQDVQNWNEQERTEEAEE